MIQGDGVGTGLIDAAAGLATAVVHLTDVVGDGAVGDVEGAAAANIDASGIPIGGVAADGGTGQGQGAAIDENGTTAIQGMIAGKGAAGDGDAGTGIDIKPGPLVGAVTGNGAVGDGQTGAVVDGDGAFVAIDDIQTVQGQITAGGIDPDHRHAVATTAGEGDIGDVVAIDIPLYGDGFVDIKSIATGQGDGARTHAAGIEGDGIAIGGIGDGLAQGAGAGITGTGDGDGGEQSIITGPGRRCDHHRGFNGTADPFQIPVAATIHGARRVIRGGDIGPGQSSQAIDEGGPVISGTDITPIKENIRVRRQGLAPFRQIFRLFFNGIDGKLTGTELNSGIIAVGEDMDRIQPLQTGQGFGDLRHAVTTGFQKHHMPPTLVAAQQFLIIQYRGVDEDNLPDGLIPPLIDPLPAAEQTLGIIGQAPLVNRGQWHLFNRSGWRKSRQRRPARGGIILCRGVGWVVKGVGRPVIHLGQGGHRRRIE